MEAPINSRSKGSRRLRSALRGQYILAWRLNQDHGRLLSPPLPLSINPKSIHAFCQQQPDNNCYPNGG